MFCRDYAELVRGQVESMGLLVETVHLSPTVSLADALDDAAQRGLLYAMIITSQHEMHRSVTLTILHGRNPQGKRAKGRWTSCGLSMCELERKSVLSYVHERHAIYNQILLAGLFCHNLTPVFDAV